MKLNFQVKLSRRLWFPEELEKLDTKVTQKVFSKNFFLGEIRKNISIFKVILLWIFLIMSTLKTTRL